MEQLPCQMISYAWIFGSILFSTYYAHRDRSPFWSSYRVMVGYVALEIFDVGMRSY
jgi:hypothetical protein